MKKGVYYSGRYFCVLFSLFFIGTSYLFAQTGVKIASSAGTAHPSAMLDVESTSKGVLVPRMTSFQRNAISSPAEGLMVYQTDAPAGYWYYNGSAWIQMGVGAISGSGSANYIPKWNSASSLTTSSLYDNGNIGIGTTGPADKLHVNGSIRAENGIFNTGSDHMEFMSGVRADDNNYEWLGFYSGSTRQGIILYDGAWSGANSLTNEFSLSAEGSNLLTLNTQANHIALMPKGGNVGIGTISPAFKLHVPSGYIGTDYINTSDNVVSSGVTGIMVKAGDNYHRTATAAAIQAFIGSSGADNLGNHTATTYLQMGSQWINFNGGGIYSSGLGNHFYPYDQYYWYMRSNRGMQVQNNSGSLLGYVYHDNGSSFGLLSGSGSWRYRVDNSNTEAYGGYFYAPTSQIGFIYDRDNTGYYFDANSASQVSSIYANNWFRAQGQTGFYFQDYGGGWYMLDGTWIRSYNSKNVYVDAQLRSDGGLVSGPIGSLGGGTIHSYGNIVNSRPSQGSLELTGDLPGYGVNTYPTIKTSGSYMYFSAGGAYSSYISTGGTYTVASSRTKKENMEELDKQDILNKIGDLEIYKWNYKNEDPNIKHIGPIAEDFWDKFHLNDNDCMVSHIDPAGVALVGVQALNENYETQKKQIAVLQATVSDFGSVKVTSKELWINFNQNFSEAVDASQLPTVTITSNKPGVHLYITEKNNKGFKLVVDSELPQDLLVDYIAMARSKPAPEVKKEPVKTDENIVPHHNQRMEAANPAPVNKPEIIDLTPKELAPENRPEISGANFEQQHAQKVQQAEEAKRKYIAVAEDAPVKSGIIADPNAPAPVLPASPK